MLQIKIIQASSKKFQVFLTRKADGFVIVGEDFNYVLNQRLEKHPFEQGPMLQKTKVLCTMIEKLGLHSKILVRSVECI